MTDTVLSAEELDALLAGTEGVTPGPWFVRPYAGRPLGQYRMVQDEHRFHMCIESVPATTAAHIARCSPDAISKLVTEVQRLRSHSRASGIKPLEWRTLLLPVGYAARTPFGDYIVKNVLGTDNEEFSFMLEGHKREYGFASLEAAKSAAQSHFNASIQSCLVAEGVERDDGWKKMAGASSRKAAIRAEMLAQLVAASKRHIASLPAHWHDDATTDLSDLVSQIEAFSKAGEAV